MYSSDNTLFRCSTCVPIQYIPAKRNF